MSLTVRLQLLLSGLVDDGNDEDSLDLSSLEPAVRWGVPLAALDLYGRWWQLETWLRQLVYVELRAEKGLLWQDSIPQVTQTARRTSRDAAAPYMGTVDVDDPLAYLDFSQLLDLIDARWDLFERTLIEQSAWRGRQGELLRIRHRIGHLRRPHADDLGRLVQILRDLQHGAFIALASYNDRYDHCPDEANAVYAGWVRGKHPDAQRLLAHAERQYDTVLILQHSRRPWAPATSGTGPGVLWHAQFLSRSRAVRIPELWRASHLEPHVKPLLVHLLVDSPSSVTFTFAGIDDEQRVADAVGDAFDAFLASARHGPPADRLWEQWPRSRGPELDFRILVNSGWNVVDETTVPIDLFSVGGGITVPPRWR